MSFNTQKNMVLRPENVEERKEKKMKKRFKKVVFENEYFIFIINEKDNELFNQAKEQSEDIYFLIENLEFLQVDFEISKWSVRK